jgi:exosortase
MPPTGTESARWGKPQDRISEGPEGVDANLTTLDEGSSLSAPEPSSKALILTASAVTLVGLGWAYAPSFVTLIDRWWRDDNYSHGFFVLPICALILWQRRGRFDVEMIAPRWWGVLPLLALLATRAWLFERNDQWFESASIPLAAACVVLALGGWRLLAWTWPALAFSCFMIPLPSRFNTALAAPLQTLATLGSVTLLQATGLPVIAEGNVIIVGGERLEVARACNGLSMLLSFATLITAMVVLVARPVRERVALLLSIVPVALLCNVLRIGVTAWATHLAGHTVESVHDWAGLAMMPVALALMWLEIRVLAWVFVEVEVEPVGLVRPTSMVSGQPT